MHRSIEQCVRSHTNNDRITFLRETSCVRTPALAYALWLATWRRQGGEATHPRDYNHDHVGFVMEGGIGPGVPPLRVKEAPQDPYENLGIDRWMPTKSSGLIIPSGYGSESMELLVLPDLVSINTRKSSGDMRPGWEWGHTTVLILRENRGRLLEAITNQPDVVESFPDVEALLKNRSYKSLQSDYTAAIKQQRTQQDRKAIPC